MQVKAQFREGIKQLLHEDSVLVQGNGPRGFPSGQVYFAGLHCKLFCYMSEGKSPSPQHHQFQAVDLQTFSATGCDGLSAGSCPEGSACSENELGPCPAVR